MWFNFSLHHLSSTKDIYILRNMSVTSITLFLVTRACNSIGSIVPHHLCLAPEITGTAAPILSYHPLPPWPAGFLLGPLTVPCTEWWMLDLGGRLATAAPSGDRWEDRDQRHSSLPSSPQSQRWCRLTSLARTYFLYHFQSPLHSLTISIPGECKDVKPTFSKCQSKHKEKESFIRVIIIPYLNFKRATG